MNIHEYQAKALLKRYGVVVPRGGVAFSAERKPKRSRTSWAARSGW